MRVSSYSSLFLLLLAFHFQWSSASFYLNFKKSDHLKIDEQGVVVDTNCKDFEYTTFHEEDELEDFMESEWRFNLDDYPSSCLLTLNTLRSGGERILTRQFILEDDEQVVMLRNFTNMKKLPEKFLLAIACVNMEQVCYQYPNPLAVAYSINEVDEGQTNEPETIKKMQDEVPRETEVEQEEEDTDIEEERDILEEHEVTGQLSEIMDEMNNGGGNPTMTDQTRHGGLNKTDPQLSGNSVSPMDQTASDPLQHQDLVPADNSTEKEQGDNPGVLSVANVLDKKDHADRNKSTDPAPSYLQSTPSQKDASNGMMHVLPTICLTSRQPNTNSCPGLKCEMNIQHPSSFPREDTQRQITSRPQSNPSDKPDKKEGEAMNHAMNPSTVSLLHFPLMTAMLAFVLQI